MWYIAAAENQRRMRLAGELAEKAWQDWESPDWLAVEEADGFEWEESGAGQESCEFVRTFYVDEGGEATVRYSFVAVVDVSGFDPFLREAYARDGSGNVVGSMPEASAPSIP